MKNNPLELAIAKTIAYYDSQDIALTRTEVWTNLFASERPYSLIEVEQALSVLQNTGALTFSGAYVVMQGREGLIEERVQRGMHAEKKFRRARRVARLLSFLPFVRMVGVCNTLSYFMPRKEGDIDIFIITKAHRLYLARVCITFVLHLFRLRRHQLFVRDRICLSFYVDEEGISLQRFALSGGDPHLAIWASHIIPIFSVGDSYDRFWKANEPFYKEVIADPRPYAPVDRLTAVDALASWIIRGLCEALLFPIAGLVETIARKNQYERMRASQHRHLRLVPTGVVLDRHTMKFHEEDRRAFYRDRMKERLQLIESRI